MFSLEFAFELFFYPMYPSNPQCREKFREFSKALLATKFNHIIALNALTMMPIFTLLVIDLSFFKNNIFSFTKKNKEIAPQCLDYDANFHTCHW